MYKLDHSTLQAFYTLVYDITDRNIMLIEQTKM